jgi:hypothetical protein
MSIHLDKILNLKKDFLKISNQFSEENFSKGLSQRIEVELYRTRVRP